MGRIKTVLSFPYASLLYGSIFMYQLIPFEEEGMPRRGNIRRRDAPDPVPPVEKLKKELLNDIKLLQQRNEKFKIGIPTINGKGPYNDRYYEFPTAKTMGRINDGGMDGQRDLERQLDILRQTVHFTRTKESDSRISFMHWMNMRVKLESGLTEGPRNVKKNMLQGLSTMLQLYNKECCDRCINVHRVGRMAWHSLVNLSYLLNDFCYFCTRCVPPSVQSAGVFDSC